MKKSLLLISLIIFSKNCFSQPWENPLMICHSNNGVTFTPAVVFQDSSGVPSVCKDSTGKLLAAFQWFPAPMYGLHWDSVAVKTSLDNGQTWSFPQPIVVQNLPANFQRPFDPTIVALPAGQIRIYFSSGPPGINTISTYSAIGTDGVNYTFEPGARFTQAGTNVIDPAVTIFKDTFQYTAPKGPPQAGAFHATSTDGLIFIQQPDIISDSAHNWTGNLMVDSLAMKFYGSGAMGTNLWMRSTADATVWDPYLSTNVSGGDPAVVKISAGNYLMIFTGAPYVTAVTDPENTNDIHVYPNPANDILVVDNRLSNLTEIKVLDISGKEISAQTITSGKNTLDISTLKNGIYFLKIMSEPKLVMKKFVVAR
jgi:hypothetical protein